MRFIAILFLVLSASATKAQQFDKAAFQQQFARDMQMNRTGMTVLGTWAGANVIGGVTGYFTANNTEAKAFWGMNAIWGATNMGFAAMGLWGSKKEKNMPYTCDKMLQKHEFYKNLFLLNAGLDLGYIGTGLVLNAYADDFDNPAMWHGFGKSIAMQGIALLLFDGTMYTLHKQRDKKWYKLVEGLCVTRNGVGFRYRFEGRHATSIYMRSKSTLNPADL